WGRRRSHSASCHSLRHWRGRRRSPRARRRAPRAGFHSGPSLLLPPLLPTVPLLAVFRPWPTCLPICRGGCRRPASETRRRAVGIHYFFTVVSRPGAVNRGGEARDHGTIFAVLYVLDGERHSMRDYLALIDTHTTGLRYDVTPLFADATAFAAL